MDDPSSFRLLDPEQAGGEARPLYLVASRDELDGLTALTPGQQRWLAATGFRVAPGQWRHLPGGEGDPEAAVLAVDPEAPLWALADVAGKLAAGAWYIAASPYRRDGLRLATLGWALATYRFELYKTGQRSQQPGGGGAYLVVPRGVEPRGVSTIAAATHFARDLINTPADDLGPSELAAAARSLAHRHRATFNETVGTDLKAAGYPAIYTVGRAGDDPPRLLELHWGREGDPLVAICGKGVCFDTGGLGLKPSSNMSNMKKDMGGAAQALALAALVMTWQLPVRLMVLVPAVENAVSGNSFRPGDVIPMRNGNTVEVGHTDAEGRLVLADALARAAEAEPAEILDFATLTGAARVALGPDVPALFSNDASLAGALETGSATEADPLWRLPLYRDYNREIQGKVADLASTGTSGFGGAIIAALFLEHFVAGYPWAHLDFLGWNTSSRPGRPEGGEAMGLRAGLAALMARYPPGRRRPAQQQASAY